MKRFASLVLAAAVAVAMSACGNGSDSANSTQSAASTGSAPSTTASAGNSLPVLSPDNPVELSIWITTSQQAPASDNKLTKLLKDKLGVTLNYEIITPDNQDQKIGVMLAGGEYPDIIGSTDQNARLVTGGAYISLDDYLKPEIADALYEHVKPYWNKIAYNSDQGKHIYQIPNYNRFYGDIVGGVNYSASGFWIQKAVLADQGYPDLSNMTLEKYFKMLEDYKNKYPKIEGQDTIAFEILCAQGREWGLTNPPEYLAGAPNNGGVIVDENNVAAIFADKDVAKRYYKFLNEMNAKGLVDKESFTQTLDQYLAKLATGRVLGMYDQRWSYGNAHDALVTANKDERTWVATMPTYDGIAPYYADRDVMNINQGVGVSVSCKQPDVAVSFINTLMKEDWQKILAWGIEGEDYTKDANGKFTRNEEQRAHWLDLIWVSSNRLMALRDIMPKHNGTYSDGNAYSPEDQPEEFFGTLRKYDQDFLTKYNKKTWRDFNNQPPENPVYYPAWNIALPDGSDAQMSEKQLKDTALQFLPKAIMASPDKFEGIWADYTKAIGKINVKAYEDTVNAGIQDRLVNWATK